MSQYAACDVEPELLTKEEIAQARETRFLNGSYDEWQRRTRELVIVISGLSLVYQRDPVICAALRTYLSGQTTLQGSLLLAYRALTHKRSHLLKTLGTFEQTPDVPEPAAETIESVRASKVLRLLEVCNDLMGLLRHAAEEESPAHFMARHGMQPMRAKR